MTKYRQNRTVERCRWSLPITSGKKHHWSGWKLRHTRVLPLHSLLLTQPHNLLHTTKSRLLMHHFILCLILHLILHCLCHCLFISLETLYFHQYLIHRFIQHCILHCTLNSILGSLLYYSISYSASYSISYSYSYSISYYPGLLGPFSSRSYHRKLYFLPIFCKKSENLKLGT